jgi:hypothetical protein
MNVHYQDYLGQWRLWLSFLIARSQDKSDWELKVGWRKRDDSVADKHFFLPYFYVKEYHL